MDSLFKFITITGELLRYASLICCILFEVYQIAYSNSIRKELKSLLDRKMGIEDFEKKHDSETLRIMQIIDKCYWLFLIIIAIIVPYGPIILCVNIFMSIVSAILLSMSALKENAKAFIVITWIDSLISMSMYVFALVYCFLGL